MTPAMRGTGSFTVVFVVALFIAIVSPAARAATLSVNCDTGGNLQAKIQAASSGATILVKGTCYGKFEIDNKTLTLKGNPSATLDGNDLLYTLLISTPGDSVHLIGLTITGGVAPFGAGIEKTDGNLTLDHVTVTGNLATDSSGTPGGGGIGSGAGNVTLINSTVTNNRVLATGSATFALGGGLYVNNGKLTINGSTISGNRVTAHPTSPQFSAYGGGFYLDGGSLVVQGSTISGNRVTASESGDMLAFAAAGYQGSVGSTHITNSLFKGNVATATSTGGFSEAGDTLHLDDSPISIDRSRIVGNSATATSPGDADAEAGGINAQYGLTLIGSTIDGNRITAVSSGGDALAEGGGLMTGDDTPVRSSTLSRNHVSAKTSGGHARAWGGGGYVSDLAATNSTVALNTVVATSGVGGTSYVDGGGLDASGCCSLVDTTIAANKISISGTSNGVYGGGLYTSSSVTIEAVILANNAGGTGPDCYSYSPGEGPTSKGHNLIRNPAGCNFHKKSTDKIGKDPKLGPLASNGGPTQTMAIALSSPARDAIPKAVCTVSTDQRGVHRPQGPRCDIGAYERKVA